MKIEPLLFTFSFTALNPIHGYCLLVHTAGQLSMCDINNSAQALQKWPAGSILLHALASILQMPSSYCVVKGEAGCFFMFLGMQRLETSSMYPPFSDLQTHAFEITAYKVYEKGITLSTLYFVLDSSRL